MTAAHRAGLRAVRGEVQSGQAPDVLTRWEPEHQLIGALMWMSAERARPIIELVPDTAIWAPTTRWAYQIIRRLIEDGRDPDPVVVLATARRRPCSDAADTEKPTAQRYHELGTYLAAAYTQTATPAAAATYAREVLEEAYRRAVGRCGVRLQELADAVADRAELTQAFADVRDELAELWRRAEAASKPGWDKPSNRRGARRR